MISGTQLSLYFGVGLYVSANSLKGKWGTGAIRAISEQLRRELPGLRGFSEESIKKMRTFAEFWSQYLNRSPMATELTLDSTRESITYDFFSLTKWSPMATEINREEFLGISFSHHMEILHKTKNINEVLCCIHEAVVHQWDKYTLRDMLKAGIPQPDHTVPNNFPQTISICSQRQSKVLVMVESEEPENPKMGQESRKCGHLKMQVIKDLKKDTFEAETAKGMELNSTVVMDNLPGHTGVEKAVAVSMKQTVPGKEAPKVLPWVHIAIANAKTLFQDMYHGIKDEFLQWYLDEYCYKFNRKYFGDRVFDRLMIAATSYKPTFAHRLYNKNLCDICG